MIPQEHQEFINRALEILKQDNRIVGLALCGSYHTGQMDEYSDIDFIVAVESGFLEQVLSERMTIAEKLGNLLSAYTGDHIGVPNLLICLFDSPLLHVDLNFMPLEDARKRVAGTSIIYDKDDSLTTAYQSLEDFYPKLEPQWLEDRFWVWVHYVAAKIGRGELFEALDGLSFLRAMVIGPLLQARKGQLPRGVRRLERDAPEYLPQLVETVAQYDAINCIESLQATIELYKALRQPYEEKMTLRDMAEKRSCAYLDRIANNL